MTESTELLSPADVAGILKVHVKTVHVWLREGRLKGTKISYRTWRISRGNLEEFLKERSMTIPQSPEPSKNMTNKTPEKKSGLKETQLSQEETHPPGEMKHYLKGIMQESEKTPDNNIPT